MSYGNKGVFVLPRLMDRFQNSHSNIITHLQVLLVFIDYVFIFLKNDFETFWFESGQIGTLLLGNLDIANRVNTTIWFYNKSRRVSCV